MDGGCGGRKTRGCPVQLRVRPGIRSYVTSVTGTGKDAFDSQNLDPEVSEKMATKVPLQSRQGVTKALSGSNAVFKDKVHNQSLVKCS